MPEREVVRATVWEHPHGGFHATFLSLIDVNRHDGQGAGESDKNTVNLPYDDSTGVPPPPKAS